jgi:hypothetical protein
VDQVCELPFGKYAFIIYTIYNYFTKERKKSELNIPMSTKNSEKYKGEGRTPSQSEFETSSDGTNVGVFSSTLSLYKWCTLYILSIPDYRTIKHFETNFDLNFRLRKYKMYYIKIILLDLYLKELSNGIIFMSNISYFLD